MIQTLDDLQKSVLSRLETAKAEIVQRHIAAGQKASGRTAASLEITGASDNVSFSATLWGRAFFQGLETGRAGGKVPRGFYHIIKQWSIDKGIQFQRESQRSTFAYFVAKKIAAEGTALFRQGGRTDIYSPVLDKLTEDIAGDIGAWYDFQITTIQINRGGNV